MLSSLSSIADRNFIIAFLMPALLAGLGLLWIFQDCSIAQSILSSIVVADKFAALTFLILALWSAALLLMAFNSRFYRILEGYEIKALTSWRKGSSVHRYNEARSMLVNQFGDIATASSPAENAARKSEYIRQKRKFDSDYPPAKFLMPTRFGNVIRSFEIYPLTVYNVSSIRVWLRLTAVISQDFARQIDNARAKVDFFVNGVFLSGLLAIIAIVRIIRTGFIDPVPPFEEWWWLLPIIAVMIAAAFSAYNLAIMCARPWGDLVRSAFDLYLPALARMLGYELPRSAAERRAFWEDVNAMMVDSVPMTSETWLPQAEPITQTSRIETVTIEESRDR